MAVVDPLVHNELSSHGELPEQQQQQQQQSKEQTETHSEPEDISTITEVCYSSNQLFS